MEFQKTREAIELRAIDLKKIPLALKPQAYMLFLFPVLARSLANVKFRAISLELRAFRLYKSRTYLHSDNLKPIDFSIQIAAGSLFIFVNVYLIFIR